MNITLLTEQMTPQEGNIITEVKANGNDVFLCGIFMQADSKNRNGRIYPMSEMMTAVNDAKVMIEQHGGIFGELDHPQTLTINMDRISHAIKEMYMDGCNVIGKAKLLNTPMGLIAKELARSGVRYGVSSRGAGGVKDGGIVEGFKFITADLVATPSVASAMPNTVYEALEQSTKGKKVLTLAESVQQDPSAQKFFQRAIMDFLAESTFKNFKK